MPKLNAQTTLALVKCVSKDQENEARDRVAAGSYPIDALVRINGQLTVAPSVPAGAPGVEAARFDPWLLLAICIKKFDECDLEWLAKRAARGDLKDKAAAESLQMSMLSHSAKLLPPVKTAGSPGRRGSVSFSGEVSAT